MRILPTACICLLFSCSRDCPDTQTGTPTPQSGVGSAEIYGYASNVTISNITAKKISFWKNLGYTGISFKVPWVVDQQSATDLSHKYVRDGIKILCDSGLDVQLHLWKGDNAFNGNNVTSYWLYYKGVDTFYTYGGDRNGPYPDFYNSTYIKYSDLYDSTLMDTLRVMIQRYPSVAQHLKYVFPSYGTTGDPGPIKGQPYNTRFNHFIIPNEVWWEYVVQRQNVVYRNISGTGLTMCLNPGNDAYNLSSYLTYYPEAAMKHGDAGHQYPIDGESYKLQWERLVWFSEFDDQIRESPYYADRFESIRSAFHVKLGLFFFMNTWENDPNIGDYIAFVKKYDNQYTPSFATKGFSVMAGKIDDLDSVNYPVSIYGPVFDNNQQYWAARRNIEKTTPDSLFMQQRLVRLAIQRRNTGRIDALTQKTGATILNGAWDSKPPGYYYNNDISWYISPNYDLNVSQIKINETSTPAYRIDDGSIYGRAARSPKPFEGRTAMYFDVDDRLIKTDNRDVITVTVTYKDAGTARWNVKCYGNTQLTITNENTNIWKRATLNVPAFKKGNRLPYGSDIQITVTNGVALYVDMVEFENISLRSDADLLRQIAELNARIERLHTAITVLVIVLVLILGFIALYLIVRRRR